MCFAILDSEGRVTAGSAKPEPSCSESANGGVIVIPVSDFLVLVGSVSFGSFAII